MRRHGPVSLANIYPKKYSNRVPKSLFLNYLSLIIKLLNCWAHPPRGRIEPRARGQCHLGPSVKGGSKIYAPGRKKSKETRKRKSRFLATCCPKMSPRLSHVDNATYAFYHIFFWEQFVSVGTSRSGENLEFYLYCSRNLFTGLKTETYFILRLHSQAFEALELDFFSRFSLFGLFRSFILPVWLCSFEMISKLFHACR